MRKLFLLWFLLLPFCALAGVHYVGVLVDPRGEILSGTHLVVFRIYDRPVGGDLLWEQGPVEVVADEGGLFSVVLGSAENPLPRELLEGIAYLGLVVDGEELPVRERLSL